MTPLLDAMEARSASSAPAPPVTDQPATTPAETPGIMSRAVCLSLEINKPGNRKKVSTSQIETDADKDMIGVSKQLVDSVEYKAISRHDGETRQWLYSRALPSPFRAGVYLIPHALVVTVNDYLDNRTRERRQLIEAFVCCYPSLKRTAEEKLGSLFNPADYPDEDRLRAGFSVSWRFIDFQTPNSLKQISSSLFAQEQAKAQAQWAEATTEVRNALREGFAELVEHMAERLAEGKIFRNSMVDNFRDFLEVFDFRNITDDADLAALVSRTRELLANVNPDHLRSNEGLRATVQAGMAQINNTLDGMMENRPRRQIEL